MRVAIIDLNDARYLDSAALRALFQLGAELRTKGGTLVFAAGVDHPLRRLITISGGTEIATLEESVDRALQQHS